MEWEWSIDLDGAPPGTPVSAFLRQDAPDEALKNAEDFLLGR